MAKRRHFSAEQKLDILRRHLLEGVPVSDLCDEHDLNPNLFYRWQKQLFEHGAAAVERVNPLYGGYRMGLSGTSSGGRRRCGFGALWRWW